MWREGFLDSEHEVVQAIQNFINGEIGRSLRSISLENCTLREIQKNIEDVGFQAVSVNLLDSDKPHMFYVHPDRGLIRLKPEGCDITDRSPYGVKCILGNITDLSYENELFKVSESGIPMPKGVQVSDHINLDPSEMSPFATKDKWLDWVMKQVHVDIIEK